MEIDVEVLRTQRSAQEEQADAAREALVEQAESQVKPLGSEPESNGWRPLRRCRCSARAARHA